MRRAAIACLLLLASGPRCRGQDLRISVFSRFHPRRIELRAPGPDAVLVAIGEQNFLLEPGAPGAKALIETDAGGLIVTIHGQALRARALRAAGRTGAATLLVSMPGKIGRRYRGTLIVTPYGGELSILVSMELETAVASVVQAESAPGTPLEALKAQAVVTRSYFVAAKARHQGFDFCDLTHCQVLRDAPVPKNSAARATGETRGLVLAYEGKPVPAMFTRSCGGRTRTPAETGLSVNGYPYFAVVCPYCHEHPFRWTRALSREDAELAAAGGEAGRLAVDRRLGWNTVPSNNFTARPAGAETILEGSGEGHGIGLCQRGAAALAAEGADFRDILSHYFPNTRLIEISATQER